ncbi:Arylsulfatase [Limihaloglobus sulfuriphilus]|uniref:Arylsulfatase n=1 Tax=Limihaloglobus sulfuriphilus TaxID=1851148 RepID=A0A1Q2ME27_9BACT|nr:sulfatase [Limihaloglobus sulfuriphilus]AQQ70512.1 Arylsulfatase [Limihaloglobus sulfuriphilus]
MSGQIKQKPNIIFIMSDDHASHAMSCYGSFINKTPQLDRIANEGMRFDNCFCTNSICTPSRAAILSGTYNHVNGVTTLATHMDNRLETFPKILKRNGYQTAVFGKWHLGKGPEHSPSGFDDWAVLNGQGNYHNPEFFFKGPEGGTAKTVKGYATDIITDMSIDWLEKRDENQPFCLLCHHKAPHRPWYPDEKHAGMYLNEDIPEPETLYDDYSNRAKAAEAALMRVGVNMIERDLKSEMPKGLTENELRSWAYQRYIKDYLRVIASIDDNVGRLLDYLDNKGLTENTMIIYTSDQGFFLGDHGWYDKRFMYEQSLRMPFIVRYPELIKAGTVNEDIVTNIDFAPTFLDLAGLESPKEFQGFSIKPLLEGATPENWQKAMYYRYWMNRAHHNVAAHYGIRTKKHKLIYYYSDGLDQPGTADELCCNMPENFIDVNSLEPEWELFDLEKDPMEMHNVYNDPTYKQVVDELKDQLAELQKKIGDKPYEDSQSVTKR